MDFSLADTALAIAFIFRTFFDLFIGLPFCFIFLFYKISTVKSCLEEQNIKRAATSYLFANIWKHEAGDPYLGANGAGIRPLPILEEQTEQKYQGKTMLISVLVTIVNETEVEFLLESKKQCLLVLL